MIYWDADRNVHFVGEDVRKVTTIQRPDGYGGTYDYNIVDGMISWAGQYQISPNGRWIAGTFRTETAVDDGNSIEQAFSPAFYDVENNKTYIMSEYGDGSGMVVTDDGIGFIGTPSLVHVELPGSEDRDRREPRYAPAVYSRPVRYLYAFGIPRLPDA